LEEGTACRVEGSRLLGGCRERGCSASDSEDINIVKEGVMKLREFDEVEEGAN
jgi:hypothetical protein